MNKVGWETIKTFVLRYDYCCGCGVCAGICPHDALEMRFNDNGAYNPYLSGECTGCGRCAKACPFVGDNPNEDELAGTLFSDIPDIQHTSETGYHLNAFVGHVADPAHRLQSASGGIASWFLKTLLEQNIVDHVICATPNPNPDRLFTFEVISSPEEIIRSVKSAYYPLELSHILKLVRKNPGRYAIIGLPCVIKAVRLAALHDPRIRKRIIIHAGLTCGQLNAKGFTESLIRRMGIDPAEADCFSFRNKSPDKPPTNFLMTARSGTKIANLEWRNFCELVWMSGMFKLRSCNFCDDVFCELADICFMDAWLPEFATESLGSSIVISRSSLADKIVNEDGIDIGGCVLRDIGVEKVLQSQHKVIKTKRTVLSYRLWIEKKAKRPMPRKRVPIKRPSLTDRLLIANAEDIRLRSFIAIEQQRQNGKLGLEIFMAAMKKSLFIRKCLSQLGRIRNIKAGMLRRLGIRGKTISQEKKS